MFGRNKLSKRPEIENLPFDTRRATYTSHARGAIRWLVDQLDVKRVWMPSYLCPSMITGLDAHLLSFYPINTNLRIDNLSWLNNVGYNDLVFFITYFGFKGSTTIRQYAKSRGAWVIEDACQALLTNGVGNNVDFVLYSLRKFIGVPDGGILIDNTGKLPENPSFSSAPSQWWEPQLNAWIGRGHFDRRGADGSDRTWYELYKMGEERTPYKPCSMSAITKTLIHKAFDYSRISHQRRLNYEILYNNIGHLSLFNRPSENEVPLGFAICLDDQETRDRLRAKLIQACIYPPIHWDIAGYIPYRFKESRALSAKILTLPCDQRYDESDMLKIIKVVVK